MTKQHCLHGLVVLVLGVLVMSPLAVIHAHNGETHETQEEADTHAKEVRTMSTTEMQQMIALLRQLIALLVEQKRITQISVPATQTIHTASDDYHDESEDTHSEESEDSESHEHEEDNDHDAADTEKKLIIEVEEHFGKTHVHIRYTDKPEDMYFADAKMDDETALVASIKARSGLSEEVIKAALTYL